MSASRAEPGARGRTAEGRAAALNFELFRLAGLNLHRGNLQEIPEARGRDVGACGVCAGQRGRGWACVRLPCASARVCDALYVDMIMSMEWAFPPFRSWCTTIVVQLQKFIRNLRVQAIKAVWLVRLLERAGQMYAHVRGH